MPNSTTYIAHHGIKGQKWGIRRYQNPDGTLTDEGRRRYGFGKGADSMVTENTKSRIKQGVKLGAKIGAGMGVVGGAVSAGVAITALSPYVAAGTVAAYAGSAFVSSLASGVLNGSYYGLIGGTAVGSYETAVGRNYIKSFDKGLDDFERREGRSRTRATNVRLLD